MTIPERAAAQERELAERLRQVHEENQARADAEQNAANQAAERWDAERGGQHPRRPPTQRIGF